MASQDIAHNPMHQIILPLRWKAISLDALCIAPTVIKSIQALEVSAYTNLNTHAAVVDHFSSYYTGYATYSAFNTKKSLAYDYGKQSSLAMLADTDNYGEVSYTPGWDHHYSDSVKFFEQYYAEEDTSAIAAEFAGSEVFETDASGGRAVAAGVNLILSGK